MGRVHLGRAETKVLRNSGGAARVAAGARVSAARSRGIAGLVEQKGFAMVKTIVAASVVSLAFGGAALAQATITGAPAGQMPVTAEPHGSGAQGMPHAHHYRHHAQRHHHMRSSGGATPTGATQP